MSKLTVLVFALGFALTVVSLFFEHASPATTCPGLQLKKIERGLPIPYISLQPSPSLCDSVESISVLWKGNVQHEQRLPAAAFDLLFWSGLAWYGVSAKRQRDSHA